MKTVILLGLLAAVFGQNTNRDKFKYLDSNGDGKLRPSDLRAFIRKFDKNGDGDLDFSEFNATRSYSLTQDQQKGAFNVYDKLDGEDDDRISISVAKAFIYGLDQNKNSEVLFEEFKENVKKLRDAITKETEHLKEQ